METIRKEGVGSSGARLPEVCEQSDVGMRRNWCPLAGQRVPSVLCHPPTA